jgi:hypothetical protein
MCFSANASFAASAALMPTGGACTAAVLRSRKYRYLPLSVVPIFFGIQQFFEGQVWRALAAGDSGQALCRVYSQLFLFFALSFWPVWMPFVAMTAERRPRWRLFMLLMMVLGLGLGNLLFGPVASDTEGWLKTIIVCNSISYRYTGSLLFQSVATDMLRFLYLVISATPLLVSSDAIVRRFGILLTISAAASYLFFSYAFASVWCFFAAIMSGYLCWALRAESASENPLTRLRRWLSPQQVRIENFLRSWR